MIDNLGGLRREDSEFIVGTIEDYSWTILGVAFHEYLAVVDALHGHVPPQLLLLRMYVFRHWCWLLRKVQPLVGALLNLRLQFLQLLIKIIKPREACLFSTHSLPIFLLLQFHDLHLLLILKISCIEVTLEHIGLIRRVQPLGKDVFDPAATQPRRSEDLCYLIEPQIHIFFQQSLKHPPQVLAEVSMRRELQVAVENVAEELVLVAGVVRRKTGHQLI